MVVSMQGMWFLLARVLVPNRIALSIDWADMRSTGRVSSIRLLSDVLSMCPLSVVVVLSVVSVGIVSKSQETVRNECWSR